MNELMMQIVGAPLKFVWPELFLVLAGMLLLIYGVVRDGRSMRFVTYATVIALLIAAFSLFGLDGTRVELFNGLFVHDGFSRFLQLVMLGGLAGALILALPYLEDEQINRFEYPVLVLFAGIGMMMMVSANDLLSLYVGLELQSLSLYVLAAIHRDSARSSEAGMKYFVLGALSSGMLLFGVSLIYGFAGTTDFDGIALTLTGQAAPAAGVIVGLVFVIAALGFKISAVPFHMWTPDVYEGAPTAVTALFAMVPKVAAIGLLMRLLIDAFGDAGAQWGQVLYALSLLTMIWAAFAGIVQTNIKRLMAYSSIGNMGYALMGVLANSQDGAGASLLYVTLYMIMTAAAFGIILTMRRDGRALEKISDLAGLSRNQPLAAYGLAAIMFSMSGVPPLAGFFSKLMVFQAAVAQGYFVLAVLGVLTSVVAAYYYLYIVKVMFFDEPADAFDRRPAPLRTVFVAGCIAFALVFVLIPGGLVDGTQAAASYLFAG